MPWEARSIVSQREEFVVLAQQAGANRSRLCERYGISRQTGYVWLKRALAGEELADRSRRPASSPGRTEAAMEHAILEARARHPEWGGRKLRAWLEQRGRTGVPSASTITAVLRRHGQIEPRASESARAWTRFERASPNELWQMDFKGPIATRSGVCQALTVLDDHSRFSVGVRACADQQGPTVQRELVRMFEVYGLPWQILCDNGAPWGVDASGAWTRLEVWLLKLGVLVVHGRPYHPQTQGKEERFHRTLTAELLRRADFRHRAHAQSQMDTWREVYNLERPHEAVDLKPPATRYRPSERAMPTRVEAPEPSPGQEACRVKAGGWLRHGGERWFLGLAWNQEVLGVKRREADGVRELYYGPYHIADLRPRADQDESGVVLHPLGRCAPSPVQHHAEH